MNNLLSGTSFNHNDVIVGLSSQVSSKLTVTFGTMSDGLIEPASMEAKSVFDRVGFGPVMDDLNILYSDVSDTPTVCLANGDSIGDYLAVCIDPKTYVDGLSVSSEVFSKSCRFNLDTIEFELHGFSEDTDFSVVTEGICEYIRVFIENIRRIRGGSYVTTLEDRLWAVGTPRQVFYASNIRYLTITVPKISENSSFIRAIVEEELSTLFLGRDSIVFEF